MTNQIKKQVGAIQELITDKAKLNKLIDFHDDQIRQVKEKIEKIDYEINQKLIDLKYIK